MLDLRQLLKAAVKEGKMDSFTKIFDTKTVKVLTFLYPGNYKEEHDEGVDHPASLSLNENGKHAHINLYCGDLHPTESVSHMADMLEEKYFTTQKNYRHLHEETRSSTKQNLEAIVKEATFEANGMPLKQLSAFFRGGDKFWALTVSTNGWTANETNSLFSRILASVELR